jgi:serine/threonine-protein kinase
MQIGQVISGKYRLLRLIGSGGMGSVYEAHHEVLGARVAIKVLHEDLANRPELVDRFLREARVLAQLSNPHVVRVLDIALAEPGRGAYIVMELLNGEPLSSILERVQRLPLPVAVDYTIQVLEALAAAHALGVVHRDLKPENVFLTREGERTVLKVIDFGIAKAGSLGGAQANLTVSGALMGTPEYMAPEQAHSADRVDARSDIYAVGVMLYEMLAGARPVDGDNPAVVALKVERGEIEPLIRRMPEVPRDLAGLVHRAMAPRPELRFTSAAEMRGALEAVMAGQRAPVPTGGFAPTPAPEPPRGTGTMFGAPAGDISSTARLPPGMSVHDPAAYMPPYAGPANVAPGMPGAPPVGSQVWPPPAPGGAGPMPQMGYGAPPPARGGRRRSGGTAWILAGVTVVICGGVVVALAFATSGGDNPPASPIATATTPPAPSTPTTAGATATATDPGLAPLPTPTAARTPHAIASTTPRGSASGAPTGAPSSVASSPAPPFGVPPFSFPSALPTTFPNPFPSPASSGVGPVITFPTAFPPFGLPTSPTPSSTPPPAPTPAPHHSGH